MKRCKSLIGILVCDECKQTITEIIGDDQRVSSCKKHRAHAHINKVIIASFPSLSELTEWFEQQPDPIPTHILMRENEITRYPKNKVSLQYEEDML